MRTINTEYYGDDTRWFIGVIRSIDDPDRLGRVRVRIFGIHNNRTDLIRDTDLPWANVVLPVTDGGTSQVTQPTGIQVGAQVFGIFMDGQHSQTPLVIGSIPHNPAYRVAYDGPEDTYVPTTQSSESYQYLVGDQISQAMRLKLEEAGARPNGQFLDQDQANELNGVTAGSGDINIELVGSGRKEQIFNYLKGYFQKRGHNNPGFIAAAFVGNFMHEAGPRLEPNTNEDQPAVSGSRGGYGLAQWTGKRRRVPLEEYALKHNAYVGNLALQLSFVTHELEGSMSFVFSYLKDDQTLESATETVFSQYENPQTSVDFMRERAEVSNYRAYIRAGGIKTYEKRRSGQSLALKAYKQEYFQRLADSKAVYTEFSG